jgi:hypothetical protein
LELELVGSARKETFGMLKKRQQGGAGRGRPKTALLDPTTPRPHLQTIAPPFRVARGDMSLRSAVLTKL